MKRKQQAKRTVIRKPGKNFRNFCSIGKHNLKKKTTKWLVILLLCAVANSFNNKAKYLCVKFHWFRMPIKCEENLQFVILTRRWRPAE